MANVTLKTIKFPGLSNTYTIPQVDPTLKIPGAIADAKVTGDAISSLNGSLGTVQADLKSGLKQFAEIDVMVENTNFATRLDAPAQILTFANSGLDITKIESLVPYAATGKFISSQGSDSWYFRTPYKNYTFGINKTSSVAYRLNSVPAGGVGETLDSAETLTPTVVGDYNVYTITQERGTIILFTKVKVFPENILSTANNHFKMDGLELNEVQDVFGRYSERSGMSSYMPLMQKLPGKLISTTTGGVSANANYDTYYFQCPISAINVKSTNANRCAITSKAPDEITGSGYLIELKYSSAAERVETFGVSLGQFVAFSMSSNSELDFASDYVKTFKLPSLRLEYGQQKQAFYKVEKAGNNTYLRIYYPSGDKIVRWSLQNTPASSINSNTWQLGAVYGYDFDGSEVSNGVELVLGGEFELAFREYGSADYCGGINHGDENTNDFTLLIDGKIVSLTNADNTYHAFDRIVAIEHATVNRCDTPSENILLHQKIWTFENGVVRVWQTLKFLETLTCDFLCGMLPASRTAFTLGVRQGNTETEVMETADFSIVTTHGNQQMYEMYGTNASARFTVDTCEHTPVTSMYINNAPTMNKLYVEFFGTLTNQQEVTSGTVLQWKQEYDIAYN